MDISLGLLLGSSSLITIHAFENYPYIDLLHLLTIKDVNPRQNTNATKRCPTSNLSVFLKDDAGHKFQNYLDSFVPFSKLNGPQEPIYYQLSTRHIGIIEPFFNIRLTFSKALQVFHLAT